MLTFKESENQLIENYINKLLPGFKGGNEDWVVAPLSKFEFILDTKCNQGCDYCYIHQFGEKLYPCSATKEQYLSNLTIIFNMLKEHKILVTEFDVFSGDILKDDLFYDLLDMVIEYKNYVRSTTQNEDIRGKWIGVTLPVNTFYLTKPYHMEKLRYYYHVFKESNMGLNVSISTDGLYGVDTREKRSECNQEFFDKLLDFAVEIEAGFHPMLSPENVANGVKNLNWWVDMYQKIGRNHTIYPMYLHVRNANWTEENMRDYALFIEACWEKKFNFFNRNPQQMGEYICGHTAMRQYCEGFDPVIIPQSFSDDGERLGCSIQKSFFIDVADLSLPSCHRLAYPQFKSGKFIVEDEKIVGVEALNLDMYLAIQTLNPLLNIKCNTCLYRHLCLKGCLGAQFEYSGEVFYPIPTVCELEKIRTGTLLRLAQRDGVLPLILNGTVKTSDTILLSFQSVLDLMDEEARNDAK